MLSNAYILARCRLIQPRTSPPKICKFCRFLKSFFINFPNFANPEGSAGNFGHGARRTALGGAAADLRRAARRGGDRRGWQGPGPGPDGRGERLGKGGRAQLLSK